MMRGALWLQSQAFVLCVIDQDSACSSSGHRAGSLTLCAAWVPEKQGPPGGGMGCTGSRGEAAGGRGHERVRCALLWAGVLAAPPPEPVR